MYKYYDNEDKKHYHELNGKPLIGTSTVTKVFPKVLTYWASGLACEKFGWSNPKNVFGQERINRADSKLKEIQKMSVEEFLKLGDEAYKAHAQRLTDSAEAGTDLHAELERFVKNHMENRMPTPMYNEKIQPFIDWTVKNVKRFIWSEAHCFSEKLWTGGISDVGAELITGEYVIIDFKSAKEVYYSQFVQCALYAVQIEENGLFDKDGNLIKKLDKEIDGVCIVPFGAKVVEPKFNWDMEELRTTVNLAVNLYKILLKNNAI